MKDSKHQNLSIDEMGGIEVNDAEIPLSDLSEIYNPDEEVPEAISNTTKSDPK